LLIVLSPYKYLFRQKRKTKAVNAHGAFTAQKAFLFPDAGFSPTHTGLLHTIALHLRDSLPDILRQPSEKQRSSFPFASAMFPFSPRICCIRAGSLLMNPAPLSCAA
jgi:hypothetical protein